MGATCSCKPSPKTRANSALQRRQRGGVGRARMRPHLHRRAAAALLPQQALEVGLLQRQRPRAVAAGARARRPTVPARARGSTTSSTSCRRRGESTARPTRWVLRPRARAAPARQPRRARLCPMQRWPVRAAWTAARAPCRRRGRCFPSRRGSPAPGRAGTCRPARPAPAPPRPGAAASATRAVFSGRPCSAQSAANAFHTAVLPPLTLEPARAPALQQRRPPPPQPTRGRGREQRLHAQPSIHRQVPGNQRPHRRCQQVDALGAADAVDQHAGGEAQRQPATRSPSMRRGRSARQRAQRRVERLEPAQRQLRAGREELLRPAPRCPRPTGPRGWPRRGRPRSSGAKPVCS